MKCEVCKRVCWKDYTSRLCNDGTSLRVCRSCELARELAERLIADQDYPQAIVPPEGLAVLAELARRNGAAGVSCMRVQNDHPIYRRL